MTDHGGPRRCECHPGTDFRHPPVEVTKFCHPRSGLAPVFFKAEKDYIDQEAGEKYETRNVGNGSRYCLKVTYWLNYFCLVFQKTETGAKTAPRVPKLGYFEGWLPKLSSRVTLVTLGASVVCHMYKKAGSSPSPKHWKKTRWVQQQGFVISVLDSLYR